MTLNDYLCRRSGNEPDVMIIHGTPRTVYRDYKGRGVLVAVGPDTYDVVRATTKAWIETLYTQGDYERWRWDGENLHRVKAEPVVTAGQVVDPNDTRPTAHRLTVTPATLRRAEALGWTPGEGDVLLWALRELEEWMTEWDSVATAAVTQVEQIDALRAERDAARRDLAHIVQLCGALVRGPICGAVVSERVSGNVITRTRCPLPPGHAGDHAETLAGDDTDTDTDGSTT